ncbi:MAG: asparagine synthetase B family protein, partial [Gemmatimonadaceae bacterium]
SGHYRGSPNWRRTSRFLQAGILDRLLATTEAFYSGIEQVPAGTAFELSRSGHWDAWRFWSISEIEPRPVPNPAAEFGALFADAVRLRMRSDVPVGISLSGGIDSVAVAALAARSQSRDGERKAAAPLNAFAYMAAEYDETSYVESIRRQAGLELHRVDVDPARLWNELPRMLWYQDEPVHSVTALVGFEIYRAAADRGVPVVLNGQGADETLAGYPFFFGHYWRTLIASGQLRRARREIEDHCRVMGGDPRTLFRLALRRATRSAMRGLVPAAVVRARRQSRAHAHPWFTPDLPEVLPPAEGDDFGNALDAGLRRATERTPLPLYLRIEDRNAMAHSVEVRLPFLDYRLVSLAFRLPPNWKMRGPWSKYVLREAMRGLIPEPVRTRTDKMGFPTPADAWFRGPLYEPMQDLLASAALRERGIYDVPAIRRDLEKHRAGEHDVSSSLFNVAQLERWIELGDGSKNWGQQRSDAMIPREAERRASSPRSLEMISSGTEATRAPVSVADSRSTTPSPPPRPTAPGGSHPATEPERRRSGGGPSAPSPDR